MEPYIKEWKRKKQLDNEYKELSKEEMQRKNQLDDQYKEVSEDEIVLENVKLSGIHIEKNSLLRTEIPEEEIDLSNVKLSVTHDEKDSVLVTEVRKDTKGSSSLGLGSFGSSLGSDQLKAEGDSSGGKKGGMSLFKGWFGMGRKKELDDEYKELSREEMLRKKQLDGEYEDDKIEMSNHSNVKLSVTLTEKDSVLTTEVKKDVKTKSNLVSGSVGSMASLDHLKAQSSAREKGASLLKELFGYVAETMDISVLKIAVFDIYGFSCILCMAGLFVFFFLVFY